MDYFKPENIKQIERVRGDLEGDTMTRYAVEIGRDRPGTVTSNVIALDVVLNERAEHLGLEAVIEELARPEGLTLDLHRRTETEPSIGNGSQQQPDEVEKRPVKAEDPSLSDEANALLTEELREVVGADAVEVAASTPHPTRGEHGQHGRFVATLISNRPIIVVSFVVAVVVGGIVGLATDKWPFLVLAMVLHAIGTLCVVAAAMQLTTEVEHVAPDVAAKLEEEGVGDPDKVFNEMIEEFAGETGGGARTAEQRAAITPDADDASRGPGSDWLVGLSSRGGLPVFLTITAFVVAGVVVFAIVILLLGDLI